MRLPPPLLLDDSLKNLDADSNDNSGAHYRQRNRQNLLDSGEGVTCRGGHSSDQCGDDGGFLCLFVLLLNICPADNSAEHRYKSAHE